MRKKILQKIKSISKKWVDGGSKRIGVGHRFRSFCEQMKRSLQDHKSASLPDPMLAGADMRCQQGIAGYLTGKILIDLGVINFQQLADALQRQREFQEKGKRKSLGVLLVEMGYTTSKEYLEALSRYFRLPVISLLKFIPSPAIQSTLAERYTYYNKLLVMADYGTELTLALSEPDPLILEELNKVFKKKEKINFYLANPFEMERCYRLYLDPFSTNFYR